MPVRSISPSIERRGAPATRLAVTFAATSLLAVVLGCVVAARSGVPPAIWSRNVAAWAVGAILAGALTRLRTEAMARAALLLTPLALLTSFLAPDVSGVHRWIALGPLTWNVAFLTLPAATVAVAVLARRSPRWVWAATPVIALALCLQPDASQATAFAAAMLTVLFAAPTPTRRRALAGLFLIATATLAWTRPDPVRPVPEVEGILELASTLPGPIAVLCAAALTATAAAPLALLDKTRQEWRPPAAALAVYFLVATWMSRFGDFPVPLVGMGMSPILGFWLGIGTLLTYYVHRIDSVSD